MSEKVLVSYEEFLRMDLRIGKIVKAEPVPKSRNLIKLHIDVGQGETKQGVAGIANIYPPDELEGKLVAVINNLQPKRIFGVESNVMILAAEDEKTISLLIPERPVRTGSRIK
jgi:methionine--tRNA ligase beta chain